MRALPNGFSGQAMTLARCWRVTRLDGVVLGFTDHDRDLVLDGVTYAAGTGLEAAQMEAELGFAIGGGEASGALSSPGITEADIKNGLYDGASVDLFLVDWSQPSARMQLESGVIGEIKRMGQAFAAEIRSLSYRLDEERGLLFRRGCAADFGDARCGIASDAAAFRYDGAIIATDGWQSLTVAAQFADRFFVGGRVIFSSGSNTAAMHEVLSQRQDSLGLTVTLWERTGAMMQPGDHVSLRAGCDKSFETCRDRFANTINFRGFPHMPGNDFVILTVSDGTPGMDGGSFFR